MKVVSYLIIILLVVVNFSLMSSTQAQTLYFDDVTTTASNVNFKDLTDNRYYGGLNWDDNWGIQNKNAKYSYFSTAVSGDYVAYNSMGDNASITSLGGNFNFIDATLTLVYDSPYNLQVKGYKGSDLVYAQTVILSHTPSLVKFDFNNINKLIFETASTGSEDSEGIYFAMDNFNYSMASTPEPSSILLGFLGIGGLLVLRRKNT